MSRGIDPLTTIMWTGDEVVSQSIPKRALKDLKDLFSNPIIIWDNYYANDYCPSRFYIGPHSGRKSLINEVKGIGINPTGLPFTDMICLSRSAERERQIISVKGNPVGLMPIPLTSFIKDFLPEWGPI